MAWNHGPDSGGTWDDAEDDVRRTHPHWVEHALAYRANFVASAGRRGAGFGRHRPRAAGSRACPMWGLTNWSARALSTRTGAVRLPHAARRRRRLRRSKASPSRTRGSSRSSRERTGHRWPTSSSSTTSQSTSRPRSPPAWTASSSPTPPPCEMTCDAGASRWMRSEACPSEVAASLWLAAAFWSPFQAALDEDGPLSLAVRFSGHPLRWSSLPGGRACPGGRLPSAPRSLSVTVSSGFGRGRSASVPVCFSARPPPISQLGPISRNLLRSNTCSSTIDP